MYAVIKTGGKQYRVEENDVLKVEKLSGNVGEVIKLDHVLALGTEKGITVGTPTVDKAVISAEVLEQKKDTKVIVFKKKRRQNYRRKNGHRQEVTVLRILDVSGKGTAKKAESPKSASPKKAEKIEEKAATPKKETATKKPAEKKAAAKKTTTKKAPAKAAAKKTTKKED